MPTSLGFTQHRDAFELGYRFLKDFQALGGKFRRHVGNPGDIATRPIEACHQTGFHRVGRADHDDRNRRGVVSDGTGRHLAEGHDHVGRARHQLLGQLGHPVNLLLCRAALD
jgi:hypothetical protein